MTALTQIREKLAAHQSEFADRFRVRSLAVFGSYARNEQRNDSDLDLLVEFSSPVGIEFIDLGNHLERLLNLRVDLVSRNGIRPQYFEQIKGDLQYV